MKKFTILLFLVICTLTGQAADLQVPLLQNVYGRNIQKINGKWNYIVDPQEMGYYGYNHEVIPWGFYNNAKAKYPSDLIEYDFDKARSMDIPSDWNTQDNQLFFYEGNVWFRKVFNYHPTQGHRTLLYFGAVNYESIVFVNGKKAGSHIGGFTPFNFDVTSLLKDGENVVIVKVDNKRRTENVPTWVFDWWNYGGITRDVMLVDVKETYIENYLLQLRKGNPREAEFQVQLNEKKAGVAVNLDIAELNIHQKAVTDAEGRIAVNIKMKPQLWTPENPRLYSVAISQNDETIHDEIGFRTIETRNHDILLNGRKIFLRGMCIHDEAPFRQGRIRNTEEAHTLLTWAKELGCNFLRLAHYPHNELLTREAERMGIMVWEEIPCYWTIDWKNPSTYTNAEEQLGTLISRDRNRANVIIWSVANETPHSDARDKFLGNLINYARSKDNTRLISLAMEVLSAKNYVNTLNDNLHALVDVVSFNQYVGWYRDVHDAPKMKWVVPYNKPIIISEFGGGALAGYHGKTEQRWTEEFQAELYRQNIAMLDKIEGLSGMTPWCLVDFRSPRRPLDGVQDYFNRKGLISEKGEKKAAYQVVKTYYQSKTDKK